MSDNDSKRGYQQVEEDSQAVRSWDRLERETVEAFRAFCLYRDHGAPRVIKLVWKKVHPKLPFNATWFNWSTRNDWVARAQAFDLWLIEQQKNYIVELQNVDAERLARSQRILRRNECFLADQAFEVASKILSMPVVRDSYMTMKDGKTIIHKTSMITPAHLLAAAALMKAGSEIGRKGRGMIDKEENSTTVDSFKRLFKKTTGEVAKEFPPGALPEVIEDAAINPDVALPPVDAPIADGGPPATAVEAFRPPRDRP